MGAHLIIIVVHVYHIGCPRTCHYSPSTDPFHPVAWKGEEEERKKRGHVDDDGESMTRYKDEHLVRVVRDAYTL